MNANKPSLCCAGDGVKSEERSRQRPPISAMVVPVKQGASIMVRKITTLLLIGGALAIAACNTVRGAGDDVKSVANCTENAINGSHC